MGYFKDIPDFFMNPKIWVPAKVLVVLMAIAAIVIGFDATGFFRYSCENKRLEHITMINVLLQDSTLNTTERAGLISLRTSAINRRNWSTRLFLAIDNVFAKTVTQEDGTMYLAAEHPADTTTIARIDIPIVDSLKETSANATDSAMILSENMNSWYNTRYRAYPDATITQSTSNVSIRSGVWYFIASTWYLLIGLLLLPVILMTESGSERSEKVYGVIASTVLLVGFMFLVNWIWTLILNRPVCGHWWVTYVIIGVIPPILSSSFGLILHFATKKK